MSIEKVREFASEASRDRLFQKVKEVEIGGRRYIIRRPTRGEIYSTGVSQLSTLLSILERQIMNEEDFEKRRKLIEEKEKIQYEFEKKLLLLCVEGLNEDELGKLEYSEWYILFSEVNEFVFIAPFQELLKQRKSRRSLTQDT
ncbi:MAG: hypothetical protein LZ168_04490 [Thaumarchaeota archaeon]|jgi:hypothetical protein|nr:hypothetical protein [Candidatus Geocrenenecus arthurdayi]